MSAVSKLAVALLVLALTLVSCGSEPQQEPAAGDTGASAPSATSADDPTTEAAEPAGGDTSAPGTYEAVLAEIEGLSAEERWDRLVELAEQEEGTLQVYATISGDEIGPVMEDFLATVGSSEIDAEHYRAGSVEVLERITQEADAGRPTADAVVTIAMDLGLLSDQGLLQPFSTPVTETFPDDLVFDDWAGVYINVYAPVRNTDLISDDEAPRTWEDLLAYTEHPIGIEVQSYDLFATLVTRYFMEQQGMTEEEAVAVWTGAPANLVPARGRDPLSEFTAAGEYAMAVGTYSQSISNIEGAGAPIAWEPPVEPLVRRPNGVAPMADSDMPATALLFVDYLLGQAGQEKLASFDRIPTNPDVEGGLPEEYDVITVDVDNILENRQKWIDLYAQVTGEPVEAP